MEPGEPGGSNGNSLEIREKSHRSWGELEGDAGLGFLGADFFTTFQVGFDMQEGAFSMGLQLRLRVRTAELGPDRQGTGVRKEDWDEPSDLAYILRYASYRRQVGSAQLDFTVGEHSGYKLGHGTLVQDYASAVDLDHPHSGFAARLGGARWLAQAFLDDLVAPEIAAARVAVVPLLWDRGPDGKHRQALTVGASGLLDFRAPLEVRVDETGAPLIDGKRNLQVSRALLGAAGIDVAYRLGHPDGDHLTIYVDGNLLAPQKGVSEPGLGLHAGLQVAVAPFSGRLRLEGGFEYRRMGPGYQPAWVDLIYDVQRLQLPLTRTSRETLGGMAGAAGTSPAGAMPTKLGWLAAGLAPAGDGYRGELGLRYGDWLAASAHYDYRPGLAGQTIGARTMVMVGRHFLAAAVVERFGVVRGEDLARGGGLLAAVEARYRPTRNLYLLAQYSRLMHLEPDGIYKPLDQLNVAFGGAWGY